MSELAGTSRDESLDLGTVELPTRRLESWKYTDLARLARHVDGCLYRPQGAAGAAEDQLHDSLARELDGHRLVFLDGVYQPQLSDRQIRVEPAPQTAAGFSAPLQALSQLSAPTAYRLSLTHSLERPLLLLQMHSGERSVLSGLQLELRLAPGVRARLIEEQFGGRQGIALVAQQLHLGAGAELRLQRLQHLQGGQFLLAEQQAELGERARLHEVHVEWGGRLSRLDARRTLAGRDSRADYFALAGLNGTQQLDHQVLVRHASPEATSRLRARGIVGGAARQVFNGKVLVERDAQRTDSDQLLRNLLLSDRAEVDAKPELEIYADDVRCAHGSTVGRLDEQALFYLRSRGLGREEARRLLMLSFAAHVLREIDDNALQQQVQQALTAHLSLGA